MGFRLTSGIPAIGSLTNLRQLMRRMLSSKFVLGVLNSFGCLGLLSAQALAATPQPDLLDTIKQRGVVRIGVSPDLPGMSLRKVGKPGFEGAEASLALLIGTQLLGKASQVELVGVDSPQRLALLQKGAIDLVIAQLTITPERQKLVDFSMPYVVAHEALLLPVNSPIQRLSQLIGKEISVAQGSASQQRYMRAWPGILQRSTNFESGGIELLRSGLVAAWANDNTNILGMLSVAPDRDRFRLLNVGACFPPKPFGIAVRKGNPALLAALNVGLAEQEGKGTLKNLFAALSLPIVKGSTADQICK